MKTLPYLLLLLVIPVTLSGQGSLTPPDAPGPTMKTLDQVEARTPIDPSQPGFTFPYNITAPGSYYLTQNLSVTTGDAITISADGVSLDLNGFTITSSAASATGTAILLSGLRKDIAISNGHIVSGVTVSGGTYSGTGFANGIAYSTAPYNVQVSHLSVLGCLNDGIALGLGISNNSTVVESCTVKTAGGVGILAASVSNSTVLECSNGLYATTASNCSAQSIGSGGAAISADTANNCYGQITGSGGYGITANNASNCHGQSSSGYGLYASITASNCFGASSAGNGLYAGTANNCYGSSSSGGYGLGANNASNCYGFSSDSQGISATAVTNCYGVSASNRGISCSIANGCYGISQGGSFGINATYLANTCYGSSATGTGLATYIAVACRGDNNSGTSITSVYHYNMPP